MEGRRLWSVGGGHPGLSRNGTQKWQFQWPKWSSITTLWGFTHLLLNFWTSFLCKDHGWPTPKTPGNGNGQKNVRGFSHFVSSKRLEFPMDFPLPSYSRPRSPMDFPKADMDGSNFRRLCKDPWTVGCWAQLYQEASDCHWPRSNKIDRRWLKQEIYGVSPKRRFLNNNTASIGSKAAIPEVIRFTSAQQPDDFELNTQESNFRDKDSLSNRQIGRSVELFGVWAF